MSRVGKLPIVVPAGVQVDISGLSIKIQGVQGTIVKSFKGGIAIEYANSIITVKLLDETARAMWGTARSIINSMIHGVVNGFQEELDVNGVGYKAAVQGKYLNLALGKSHNTKIEIPNEISVVTPKQNVILLKSYDKQKLGQYIALIKSQRPPEPYKGKGIKRKGEYIQRKESKKG